MSVAWAYECANTNALTRIQVQQGHGSKQGLITCQSHASTLSLAHKPITVRKLLHDSTKHLDRFQDDYLTFVRIPLSDACPSRPIFVQHRFLHIIVR
jgi:hypothetical protein